MSSYNCSFQQVTTGCLVAPANHWQHFNMTFLSHILILLIGYCHLCTAIAVDWKNIDLKELELPSDVEDLKQKVDIKQQRLDVTGVDMYYQVFIFAVFSIPSLAETFVLFCIIAFASIL